MQTTASSIGAHPTSKSADGTVPFHFHARLLDMSAVAEPGGTDLQAAEAHGVPALVITSLSKDRLQIDWYRRGNGG